MDAHNVIGDTETAIVEAARDLLAERGPDGLSMRAVAARVGLSATAIYNYFENKQALVDRVVLSGFRRFEVYLRAAAERHPTGSPDRLYALGEAYIRFALENRQYFRVIFSIGSEPSRDLDDLPAGGGYELLRETVAEAIEAGRLRPADPDLVALYLWTHVHGLVTLHLACRFEDDCCPEGVRMSPPELFARFREFLRDGLRPAGDGRPGPDGETPAADGA